jgi:hypothetical protein
MLYATEMNFIKSRAQIAKYEIDFLMARQQVDDSADG